MDTTPSARCLAPRTARCGEPPPRAAPASAVRAAAVAWRAARTAISCSAASRVDEPDRERWLASLEAAGFNTLALTVYANQGDWDGADLRFATEAPTDRRGGPRREGGGPARRPRAAHRARLRRRAQPLPLARHDHAAPGRAGGRLVRSLPRVRARPGRRSPPLPASTCSGSAASSTRWHRRGRSTRCPSSRPTISTPPSSRSCAGASARFEGSIDPKHLHGAWRETYASVPALHR